MTELNFYRFVMFWLVVAAAVVGVRQYGDYRINQFVANQGSTFRFMDQSQRAPQQAEWRPQNSTRYSTRYTTVGSVPNHVVSGPPVYQPNPVKSPVPTQSPAKIAENEKVNSPPFNMPKTRGSNRAPAFQPSISNGSNALSMSKSGVDSGENLMLAEIKRIQQQLGGSQIARILEKDGQLPLGMDSEKVFDETLLRLQTARNKRTSVTRQTPESDFLTGEKATIESRPEIEMTVLSGQLRQLAEQLENQDPQASETCARTAKLLLDLDLDNR